MIKTKLTRLNGSSLVLYTNNGRELSQVVAPLTLVLVLDDLPEALPNDLWGVRRIFLNTRQGQMELLNILLEDERNYYLTQIRVLREKIQKAMQ